VKIPIHLAIENKISFFKVISKLSLLKTVIIKNISIGYLIGHEEDETKEAV
tara:strand:+ start:25 stop:177 length:153 start_codon:yes stop_codon:yes gene_type:complete